MTADRKAICIMTDNVLVPHGFGEYRVCSTLDPSEVEGAALAIVDRPETCATIRQRDAAVSILAVVAGEHAEEAIQAGADDVVCAPYSLDELRARVRKLLDANAAGARRWAHECKRLSDVLSQAPVAICVFERPGLRYVFANAAYRELVGGRDVVGKQLLEALPEIAHQGLDAVLEGVLATGETYYGNEVTFRLAHHQPGELAVMNFQYTARRDHAGKIDGVIATVVDVTEQVLARQRAERLAEDFKRSERQLADEREKLAGVFEVSPAAMALWHGAELTFDKVNPQYQAIFPGRELLGRPLLDAIPELRGQPFAALMANVLATGVPYVGREVPTQLVTADGTLAERFFDFTYARIDDSQGRPLGVYDHAIDVTDRVLAHRALVESQARETQLRQQAEQANRSKDDFLAMLGHELRNPLAPIATALELMQLRGDDVLAEERTVIRRQVDHITRLIEDLLDVSRITRGKVEITRVRVGLASLVASAVEIASPLLEQRQHQLEVRVAPDVAVDGDPVRLSQVISNLLTNSAKYTEPGGRIVIESGQDGDVLWLTVTDNGVGIDPAMLPHVFELFTQEPQSIERSRGGLGLGLAIVKNLVALHGGSVSAESEGRGQGSRFTLRLPAASKLPAGVPATPVVPPVTRSTAGKRVLIVDDNEDAAELLGAVLEMRGHAVVVANDGVAALRAVETFTPDLALLDIGLPVMDGYELAGRLRQLPALQHIRMVALTGYGQPSDRQRTAAAGFDAHLVKPLRMDELDVQLTHVT